jgi:hypothetical protein
VFYPPRLTPPALPRPPRHAGDNFALVGALVAGVAIGALSANVARAPGDARAAAPAPVTVTKIHTVRVCDAICTAPSKRAAVIPETNYAADFLRGEGGSLPAYDRNDKVRATQYGTETAERAIRGAARTRAEADGYRARLRLQEQLSR